MKNQEEKYYNQNIDTKPVDDATFFVKYVRTLFKDHNKLIEDISKLKDEDTDFLEEQRTLFIKKMTHVYKKAYFSSIALENSFYDLPEDDKENAQKIIYCIFDDMYEMGLNEGIDEQRKLLREAAKKLNKKTYNNFNDLLDDAIKKTEADQLHFIGEIIDEYNKNKDDFKQKPTGKICLLENNTFVDQSNHCDLYQIKKNGLNIISKNILEQQSLLKTIVDKDKIIEDRNLILEKMDENHTLVHTLGEEGFAKIDKGIDLIIEHEKLEKPSIEKDIRDYFCECEGFLYSKTTAKKNTQSIKNGLKGGY